MPKPNAALLILAAAVAACGTAEGDVGGGAMSTDSAGVHVVHIPGEADAPEWQTEQRYREVWSVSIDQEHELAGIDAARLLEGHVAASILGRDPGVAFLDRATGTLLRRVGRLGEGPGEFRDIGRLYPGDDAVSAFDRRLRRVTTFTTSGELTGAADLGAHFGSATRVAMALPHQGGAVLVRSVLPDGEGTVRPPTFVERYERGAATASVGPFQGSEIFIQRMQVEGVGAGVRTLDVPFARSLIAAAVPEGLLVADTETAEARTYNLDLDLVRIIRLDVPVRPVTTRDLDQYVDSVISGYSNPVVRRNSDRSIRERHHHSTMPAAAGLVVGGAGDLWWLMHDSPAGNSSYRVVRADGTPCCRVEIEGHPIILDADDRSVLLLRPVGTGTDELVLLELEPVS